MSDAVDRAVSQIDFRELAGQKVFFETKYLVNTRDPLFPANQKGLGFINAEYIISSLRQQMVTADLRLQDKVDEADFVVEARIGAVGFDSTEVVYGIPASAPLSSAATSISGTPVPTIPEISFARKNIQLGAAKVGVFAYDRRTRSPVWQSGIAQAVSDARDSWLFGVGPFQDGSIYKGTQFEGRRMRDPGIAKLPPLDRELDERAASFLHDAPSGAAHSDASDRLLKRPDGGNVDPAVKPASTTPAPTPPGGSANGAAVKPANEPRVVSPSDTSPPSSSPPPQQPQPITQQQQQSERQPSSNSSASSSPLSPMTRTAEASANPVPGLRADGAELEMSHVGGSDSLSASWRSLLESARASVRDTNIERMLDRSFATAPTLLGPMGLSNAWPAEGTAGTDEPSSSMSGPRVNSSAANGLPWNESETRTSDEGSAGSRFSTASDDAQSGSAWHASPDSGPLRFPFPLELPDTLGKAWPLRSKKRSL
jgi:hypothetical protein